MLGINHTIVRRLACCLVLATLALGFFPMATLAQSQASSGQITGTVRDSSGAAVAGATVTAKSEAIGLERAVVCRLSGEDDVCELQGNDRATLG